MAPVVAQGFGFWHNSHGCVTLFFPLSPNITQCWEEIAFSLITYFIAVATIAISLLSQSQCDPIQWISFLLWSFILRCNLFCSIARKLTPLCCWETDSFLLLTARWCYASCGSANTERAKEWKPSCELNRTINLFNVYFCLRIKVSASKTLFDQRSNSFTTHHL